MEYFVLAPDDDEGLTQVGTVTVDRLEEYVNKEGQKKQMAVARPSADSDLERFHLDDVVIHPLELIAAKDAAKRNMAQRVTIGFGETCGKIAILIAMASIIGMCLLESGAADRIVRSALKVMGEPGAPVAFVGSGFLLGIPVFFDTVFYLLMPLGKAMHMRTGRNYLLYVLTIVCGATMAHSLVPPTPGPLFVAEELGVDLGLMILVGCAVGLISATAGYFYALVSNRLWELPLRDSPDISLDDLKKMTQRGDKELPSLAISLAPILLPVLLIGAQTFAKSAAKSGMDVPPWLLDQMQIWGDKNIALTLAAAVAMATLIVQKRPSLKQLAVSTQGAIASAGVIILITAAGGAFGAQLKQTGVANLLKDIPQGSTTMMLVLAFLVTTAVRTAQGSATVAMITAVGILAPIAAAGGLACHPVYLALAIGCGSKPLAWMNDSGFWVICKMSGMTEGEGLKAITPLSLLMGLTGLGATILGATVWPMTP